MTGLFLLGVIGLIILCLLCPSRRTPSIESEVRGAAFACAGEVGLDPRITGVRPGNYIFL